jgi:hypothetical protein
MERTPKQYVTLDYDSEVLTIDAPARLRARKHRGKLRLEIEGQLVVPRLSKNLDKDTPPSDITGTT